MNEKLRRVGKDTDIFTYFIQTPPTKISGVLNSEEKKEKLCIYLFTTISY